VKELGVYVKNCPCLARDLARIFEIYKAAGKGISQQQQQAAAGTDPATLPFYRFASFRGFQAFDTPAGEKQRFSVNFVSNNAAGGAPENGTAFFSSAPAEINTPGRTNDITALINTINNATKFVYASVMEYMPMALYVPKPQRFWWSELDTALRNAVMRNVHVRLMVSKWNYTDPSMFNMMASYESLRGFCSAPTPASRRWCKGSIQIKVMDLPDPSYSPLPDHTRVNHAKYAVTEKQAYISTSNWSWDYFYTTAGISYLSTHESLRSGVQRIFERDWASKYCHPLTDYFKLDQQQVPQQAFVDVGPAIMPMA
jgi:phospholipase D3/4